MENNEETKILDVGCGVRPRGDINLDLVDRTVPNFILGNAIELPFDDKSFATVYSSGLSLWGTNYPIEELLKSWQEAIRVAKHQVVNEFNYTAQSKTWHPPHPLEALKWCHDNVSSDITLEYSERGKLASPIRLFEKVFGTKSTIFVLNKIFRRSYYGKFKLYLSEKRNLPEIKEY